MPQKMGVLIWRVPADIVVCGRVELVKVESVLDVVAVLVVVEVEVVWIM